MSQPSPPPATARPTAPPSAPASGRTARAVAAVVAAAGVLALAGTVALSATATADDARRSDASLTAAASGVTSLDVDVTGARLRVVPGDGDAVELDVRGSRGAWYLGREGGRLVVSSPPRASAGWFGGDDEGGATLRLPPPLLAGDLDADVTVTGGSFDATAYLEELRAEVSGGSVTLDGTVSSLEVTGTAGDLQVDTTDLSVADVRMTAGTVRLSARGAPPDSVAVDVTAGDVDLALPPAEYDVRVGAADVQDGLRSSSTSPRRVVVTVAAGSAVLRESS